MVNRLLFKALDYWLGGVVVNSTSTVPVAVLGEGGTPSPARPKVQLIVARIVRFLCEQFNHCTNTM